MKKLLYMAVAAIAALSSCTSDDIFRTAEGTMTTAGIHRNGECPLGVLGGTRGSRGQVPMILDLLNHEKNERTNSPLTSVTASQKGRA